MNASLQLTSLNLIATAAAFLCAAVVRGDTPTAASMETAAFLLYTAWPLIGMALAVLAVVAAVREGRARRRPRQAVGAALVSLGLLVLIPMTFVPFTP